MDVSTLVQVVALICVSFVLLMGKKKKESIKNPKPVRISDRVCVTLSDSKPSFPYLIKPNFPFSLTKRMYSRQTHDDASQYLSKM